MATQDEVERLLEGWEEAMPTSNSVEWVRSRLRTIGRAPRDREPQTDAAEDLERHAEWWAPPAAIGWIATELDELRESYVGWRSALEPDAALERACAEALDESSSERLQAFFDGEMDVVYGAGAGERVRTELRDALERQWTHQREQAH